MCKVEYGTNIQKKIVIETRNGKKYESEGFYQEEKYVDFSLQKELSGIEKERMKELILKNSIPREQINKFYIKRIPEKDTIYLTDHALLRMKQRNGWSKKTAKRMLQKVYDQGMRRCDIKAHRRKFLESSLTLGKNDDFIIYGENIYIFHNQVLMTVFREPKPQTEKQYIRTEKHNVA